LSSIITALIATLSFDFFFIPPQFSFSISDLQYVFTFIVMATVGVLFGVMNGNLRFQLNISRKIQKQTRILYAFSRKLSEAMVESQVVEATTEFIPQLLTGRYALLVHTLNEELSIMHNQGLDDMDMVIAQWVFDNLKSAGYGTNTFSSSNICYIPIHSKIRSRGVLAILPDENDIKLFLPDTQELIENITQLLASTLERIHFTQIAIKTEVMLAKSEL
jgi:two-component system sensor histidine kinase KdpD